MALAASLKRPAPSDALAESPKRPSESSSRLGVVLGQVGADALVGRRAVEVQGHRGLGDLEPHNSLRAFRAAGALSGVSSVEFDVQMSSDSHLVVSHGAEHGESAVPSQTLAQLQASDLGQGERTPTLAEVVDVCLAGGLIMNVELKTDDPVAVEATMTLLREKKALPSCRVSSFKRYALQQVMRLAPEVPVGALYNPSLHPVDPADTSLGSVAEPTPADFVSWFGDHREPVAGDSINLRSETVTAEEVKEANRHGKKVLVWYPCLKNKLFDDSADEYRRVIDLGVDVVCCNRPDILVDVLAPQLS